METEIQKENEEKKEYLKSYRRAVKREKDILDEIQRLRADNWTWKAWKENRSGHSDQKNKR